MPDLVPVVKKEAIQERIVSVAREISADYAGREVVVVGVLKGAFIFLADLVRQLTVPVQVDFIRAASYGASTTSSETIRLQQDIKLDVAHKEVLIVEDIVDTGLTIRFIVDHIKALRPKSVKVCTLVDKLERRKVEIEIDYVCHRVREGFLVGYGLDFAENYRNLPEIYHLKPNIEDGP